MKLLLCALSIVGYIALAHSHTRKKLLIKEQLDQLYKGISGFKVDMKEYDLIRDQGADPTYGEITYESTQQLLESLDITADDVLYDLGSGVGKFAVHAYLATPACKVVGVELSPTRHNLAQQVQGELAAESLLQDERILDFKEENIIETDLSDATIIYMCSTCFSHELMETLCETFKKLAPGLRVISLKRLPKTAPFILIDMLELPMTWSKKSSVFIYILNK